MKSVHQIILDEYFEPTIGKAVRVMLALVLPLLWGMMSGHVGPAVWIAITAQVLSSVNIRGAYPLKLLILSGAVLACSVAAALGVLMGSQWIAASLLMMVLAFLGGFVRQSGDHGPGITIAVLLLYLLCLDSPGAWTDAGNMFLWVFEGGVLALISTLVAWAFVPFSPFRRSVALTWKTLAEWLRIFALQVEEPEQGDQVNTLDEKELALRSELQESMETLSRQQALAHARQNRYSYQLVELRRLVSEAGTSVSSLRTLLETMRGNPLFPAKSFRYVLETLSQAAHRMGICIVTHRPEDAYTVRLSIERLSHSISFFLKQLSEKGGAEIKGVFEPPLIHLQARLNEALDILDRSTGRSGRMMFFLHNFLTGMTIPQRVPWVRFEFNTRSFTFRFSLRLALGMGIGIALYKYFHIPHGYWIAMTTMIVLQPEFGSTITKALDRVKGTVSGAVVGSLLFLIPLPLAVNIMLVAICVFFMTYFVLRNYAVAAFFITVMVIALFHLLEPVTWQLGGIRVLNTLAGCSLALLGGFAFWPLWERHRFPALIREAVSANQQYLTVILDALREGRPRTFNEFVKRRREAELTNHNAFLSLRRMENEPQHERKGLRFFFILEGHSIRITRMLNTLNQQIRTAPVTVAALRDGVFQHQLTSLMERVCEELKEEHGAGPRKDLRAEETQGIFQILDKRKDEDQHADPTTLGLLERIAKEVVGMYYTVQRIRQPEVF